MNSKYVRPSKILISDAFFHGLFSNNDEAAAAEIIIEMNRANGDTWLPFFIEDVLEKYNLDESFKTIIDGMRKRGLFMRLKNGKLQITGGFLELFPH
jgi:hypothetical protein